MPSAPLDTLEMACNSARVRLNDAIESIQGDILTDNQPFTLQFCNNAWRRMQELLVNFGVTWFKPETIFSGVTPVEDLDPGSQCYISWANYFDGENMLADPVLPQNMISPLILWERPTGNGSYLPMDRLDNGLPGVPKNPLNKVWEWRNGSIYLPGATQTTDIRMRYAAFFPDFVAATIEAFSVQPIPIVRALNPLAWFICAEVAKSRGDLDAASFDQMGQMATKQIFDLDPMQAKSIDKESEYGKMPDRYTPAQGPAGTRGSQ